MRQVKPHVRRALASLVVLFLIPVIWLTPKRRHFLFWGPIPLINNKYWSEAMNRAGRPSRTLIRSHFFRQYSRDQFDTYFEDLIPRWLPAKGVWGPAFALFYVARHGTIIHIPFSGGPLATTHLWRFEAALLRAFGLRTVVIPYGADVWMLSRVTSTALRHVSLADYPESARNEPQVALRVRYWTKNADCIVCGGLTNGIGRWDVITVNPIVIDCDLWTPQSKYSPNDGLNGRCVRVLHSPNHRLTKGTEFLIRSVEELRGEGLNIELVVLEGIPNEEIRTAMSDVDIMAESFVFGYGMSGVEAMASGLPVMTNLGEEIDRGVHRRYAFLDECPILSTTPETLTSNLRLLVTSPSLREDLGRAGRKYVEKYHSYETAQYMFGLIHRKIESGEEINLVNMFHPVLGDYNRSRPPIKHPLVRGQYVRNRDGVRV